DALQATDAEVEAALLALDQHVRSQQAAYADLRRAADEAERRAEEARAAEAAKAAEIEQLRDQVAEMAVESYVNPPADELLDLYTAESASEAARREHLLDLQAGHDRDLLDQLRQAEQQLEAARLEAEEASEQAHQRRDEA